MSPVFLLSIVAAILGITNAHAAPQTLTFSRACEKGEQLVIGAVGDILLHTPLQQQARYFGRTGGAGFVSLWRDVENLLRAPDLTYANLEGPAAYGQTQGSYPAFNYDPTLIRDLVSSGVDVVSTANNHALDRGAVGVNRTIESLIKYGLPFTGTRSAGDRQRPWYTVTDQGGFRLAWVACTYETNGIPDKQRQVFYCYKHANELEAIVRSLSSQQDIDAVIVTPHWGQEYQHKPEAAQRKLADRLFRAGALAIIGSHPHVLQPWEKVVVNGKERFIIYSLGNFVSGQTGVAKRATLMVFLGLSRNSRGEVWINGVRDVPLVMTKSDGVIGVRPADRLRRRSDNEGPAQSLALIRGLFGQGNELGSQQNPVTNSHCFGSDNPGF